ncbi:MAG: hypothetical protein ACK40L_14085, partial [Hydrogenophaga sp.]
MHSPLSPIAPLPKRNDVLAWSLLTDVTTRVDNRRIVPVYPAAVRALNQKKQRLQGFMMPLEPGEHAAEGVVRVAVHESYAAELGWLAGEVRATRDARIVA